MATISLTDPVNGTTADANLIATNNAAVEAAVNGGLQNVNLATDAAIAISKLAAYPNDSSKVLLGNGSWGTPVSQTIYRKNTSKDVVSSTTETDLLNGEITIGAGVIGATGFVRATLIGDYLNNAGSNETLTLKVKLGTTTLWGDAVSIAAASTRRSFRIVFEIANQNAQNTQLMSGLVSFGSVTAGSVGGMSTMNSSTGTSGSVLATTANLASAFGGIASEDTTTSKALVVSATHGVSNAALSIRLQSALIEVI